MNRKILLISPREPSGATWLINCFLELGILTYRDSVASMWEKRSNSYFLKSNEFLLKKWLPALSKRVSFSFNPEIEIEWRHTWPTDETDRHPVIFFIRDPRDALYSRYKRENPDFSFREFISFLDHHTLLDKIDRWIYFTSSWLCHPKLLIVKFEDTKIDAFRELKRILDFIAFPSRDDDIVRAVGESTFEKAKQAELEYRQNNPQDTEIINRSGTAHEWEKSSDKALEFLEIEKRTAPLLTFFNYPHQNGDFPCDNKSDFPLRGLLSFFSETKFGFPAGESFAQHFKNIIPRIFAFLETLDAAKIAQAKLWNFEAEILIASITEFLQCYVAKKRGLFERLYTHYNKKSYLFTSMFKSTGKIRYLFKWEHGYRLKHQLFRMMKWMKRKCLLG